MSETKITLAVVCDTYVKSHIKFKTKNKQKAHTAWKVSKYGVISGPYFPVFGPEITPYLATFDAVTESTERQKN